uniref:Neprosin PEP catalytic domain-containing protein n=1 Tax=Ananas comosus var. bracteatus TaxID=296719 RepID=A0A6V7PEP5_ANACO|nr:unnamed protein product [Ananas comosus var. bracteatus]
MLNMSSSSPPPTQQEWQRSGTCPEGTVPVLRTHARNTTRAANFPMTPFFKESLAANGVTTEAAYAYSTNGPYHGANADIYLWDIHVEPNEYSTNFIAVGGDADGRPLVNDPSVDNAILVGWMAAPPLYGDSKPRLYVYWTNDGGRSKNCWNFDCGGFVQTSKKISLGASFSPTSKPGGEQRHTTDAAEPKWWVSVNLEEVGYLPDFVFNNFVESFLNGWGGQLLNTNPGGQHTSTQMGSGRFPSEGINYAGMIGKYLAVDYNGELANDYPAGSKVTQSSCYDYKDLGRQEPEPGYYILYGGPVALTVLTVQRVKV